MSSNNSDGEDHSPDPGQVEAAEQPEHLETAVDDPHGPSEDVPAQEEIPDVLDGPEEEQSASRRPRRPVVLAMIGVALLLAFGSIYFIFAWEPKSLPDPARPSVGDSSDSSTSTSSSAISTPVDYFSDYYRSPIGINVRKMRMRNTIFLLVQVVRRVVLPIGAAGLVWYVIYTVGSYFPVVLLYFPLALQAGLFVVTICAVLALNLFKWGAFKKTSEDFIQKIIECIRRDDSSFFETFPITDMSQRVYSEALIAYASIKLLAVGDTDQVIVRTESGKIENGSIGSQYYSDSPYLPVLYSPNSGPFEMAGRSKSSILGRVAVTDPATDTQHYLPSDLCVRQYGDDTVGCMLDGSMLVVADGVGGSVPKEHAPYASYACVLLSLLAHRSSPEVSIFRYYKPLYRQIVMFMRRVMCKGATTLTTAQITPAGLLRVLHFGDSYCSVLRDGCMVFSTSPLQYRFNCPYSLSSWRVYKRPMGYEFQLKHGDVVLLYSDGIGDNLWPDDIAALGTSGRIAAKAVEVFLKTLTCDIPFGLDSPMPIISYGKMDDVSIISYRYSAKKEPIAAGTDAATGASAATADAASQEEAKDIKPTEDEKK